MNKQIFGYTPVQKPEENYVPFITAVMRPERDFLLSIRNDKGVINEIVLTRTEARKLGIALMDIPTNQA